MTTLKLSLSLTNPPRRVPIEITADSSAKNLFQVASEATKIPLDNLKLIFRGRIIANSNEDGGNVVDEFKLEDGSVIHCMGKPVEGNGPVTSTAPVVATAPTGPAAAAGRNVDSSPAVSIPPPLENALARMKSNHSVAEYKAALDTLTKLLSNVIQHPMEEKYRKVKKSNPVFHKRLGRLTGATETLSAIGFCSVVGGGGGDAANDDGEEYYVLTPSPDAWPKLLQSKETIDQAVRNHEVEQQQQQQQQRQPQNSGNPSSFLGNTFQSGMNPMNFQSGMGAAGVDPSVMSNILSNPNALRDLLQNPALQQMMQNHPYFANNPMMMEQMRMLANNPQMMDQISRMMSDPMQVSRMNDMMNSMQGGSGLGFGTGSSGGTGSMNMSQQMEIMRQMANLSRGGSSSSSNSSAAGDGIHPSSTFTAQMSNSANNTTTTREHSNVNPSTTATSNSSSSSSNNNRNDSEMTEDEMIAEAIARSLREQ